MNDTIVAIATSSGISSIGIIRISGKDTFKIIDDIFKTNNNEKRANSIKYGHIIYENQKIDEVLVSFFVKPNSFTREDVCEINCHGGTVILNKILQIVISKGARLAQPGEFTKRAFLNGRIDLSEAEAVIDIINSKTDKVLKEAEKQLSGVLSDKISQIEKQLLDIISDVEANIDYPEYDVEEVSNYKLNTSLDRIQKDLETLIHSFDTGKILKEGISIALVGKPNVGKSSILNMLLGEDRAIVTDVAGTTRDTIEEYINIKGIPVKVVDTAGIRDTDDVVEKIGVDKSLKKIDEADIVIAIFDISDIFDNQDMQILKNIKDKKKIVVLNKVDLDKKADISKLKDYIKDEEIIEVSAKQEIGLEILQDNIYKLCNIKEVIDDNEIIITNVRHKTILEKSLNQIKEAKQSMTDNIPIDILSIKITDVLITLGEITGKTVSEEIINTIFSKFCLGK